MGFVTHTAPQDDRLTVADVHPLLILALGSDLVYEKLGYYAVSVLSCMVESKANTRS